jgi:hypothetical protein
MEAEAVEIMQRDGHAGTVVPEGVKRFNQSPDDCKGINDSYWGPLAGIIPVKQIPVSLGAVVRMPRRAFGNLQEVQ